MTGGHYKGPNVLQQKRRRPSTPKICNREGGKSPRVGLYHNPDPLVRLIGEANEAIVKINGQEVKALIDTGTQVSSISKSFANELGLEILLLEQKMDIEGSGGYQVPYEGHVGIELEIPGINKFKEVVLMIVVPDSRYTGKVPITLGTLHIDMVLNQIPIKELEGMGNTWGRGIMASKFAKQQVLTIEPTFDLE